MKAIIYTTSHCNVCVSVMDWLDKIGVEYEERNAEDDAIRKEINDRMGSEFAVAPTTVIGDEVIEGFNRPALLKAIEKHGLKK